MQIIFTTFFSSHLLNEAGVPQRTITALVGQSQSEVSEILKGRQVQAYDVLARICTGLGVPREAMGLSFGAYPGDSLVSEPGGEDEADVLRRQFEHLLALAGTAVLGAAIPGLGTSRPDSPPGVPARIGSADVEAIHDLTRAVAVAARTDGGRSSWAGLLAG